ILLQAANSHGKIIQHAETLAVVRVSVVKTAAHINAHSILERQTPGQNRPAGAKPNGSDQFRGIRDLQPQDFPIGELAGLEFAQVFPVVNQRNILIRGWWRLDEISWLG